MPTFDLVTLGEPIICLDACGRRLEDTGELHVSVGGAECNVAIGLARLGHRSAVIGRVGADPFGRAVRRRLMAEQVDVSGLTVDTEAPTALLFEEETFRGPDVHYGRAGAAGARTSPDDIPPALANGARRIHVTGVTAALGPGPRRAVAELMTAGRDAGATLSYDANFRRKLAPADDLNSTFDELTPLADEVFLGWGEVALLARGAEASIRSFAVVAR